MDYVSYLFVDNELGVITKHQNAAEMLEICEIKKKRTNEVGIKINWHRLKTEEVLSIPRGKVTPCLLSV